MSLVWPRKRNSTPPCFQNGGLSQRGVPLSRQGTPVANGPHEYRLDAMDLGLCALCRGGTERGGNKDTDAGLMLVSAARNHPANSRMALRSRDIPILDQEADQEPWS